MNEREIFLAAIEYTDPTERAAYLDQACEGRADLRAQIDKLLGAHLEASRFLETPAVGNEAFAPTRLSDSPELDDSVQAERPSGETEFLRYLQPATRPGWLGRLGHYEIEHILGRGAFGIVAKAFDEKLQRVVAVKLLNPDLASTSPPRKRFLREARTVAAVTHENIVAIYAVEEEPVPYLVMEYISGPTLQQRMDAQGPLDVRDVLWIGQQVASGLAAAHAVKLIHRDIKPSNILLTGVPNERIRITDFGLARAVDDASLTNSGVIAGTPLYMAPEQARGEALDHRADLFSLGSVLYQMVSGRPPFRAASTVAVLKRVCEDTPRPLNDVIPQTPAWLEAVIFRLLEKNPEDRFQSAQEVADLLGRYRNELQLAGTVTPLIAAATSAGNHPAAKNPPADTRAGSTSDRDHWRTRGFVQGLLMAMAALAFVLIVAPRTVRWFDAPIPELPPSETQGGLRFDGRDDWVQVSSLGWHYPQFTIEAFVTSAPGSDNGTIVCLSSGPGAENEWMSLFDGGPADPGKRISGAGIKGKPPYENAYGPFAGGRRQHRALVFDGRYLNYYINGVWQGQRRAEPHEGLEWKMSELRIGCDSDRRRLFQGVIDQLRVSRVARYETAFTPASRLESDERTLALYRFEDRSGNILTDASGHGHHGTIHGATWITSERPAGLEPPGSRIERP